LILQHIKTYKKLLFHSVTVQYISIA